MGRNIRVSLSLSAILIGLTGDVHTADLEPRPFAGRRIMSAEFEKQAALLIAWDSSNPALRQVHRGIVAGNPRIPVLVLVKNPTDHLDARRVLQAEMSTNAAIRVIPVALDSPWVRDYGPTMIRSDSGEPMVIDAAYDAGTRPNDDLVPCRIGELSGYRTESTGLRVDGGNLLTNGAGLGIATDRLLAANLDVGYSRREAETKLRSAYGLDQLIFLEPLAREATGHVDMFATFTSFDTVVVGAYSIEQDPTNAEILDRNAARLAGLRTPSGHLKVVRMPMPPNNDGYFRTWLNVVFANDTLLVPTYPGVDPISEAIALQTYQSLLRSWRIKTVDCSQVIVDNGALHCLTMNLTHLPKSNLWQPIQVVPSRIPQNIGLRGGLSPHHATSDRDAVGGIAGELLPHRQPQWAQWIFATASNDSATYPKTVARSIPFSF